MKKHLVFIFLSIFAAARLISPHVALAACDPNQCDCVANLQVVPASSCPTACLGSHNRDGTVNCHPPKTIPSPKDWLSNINPGFGPNAGLGLGFFTDNVATFIISAAIFILFTASLIFLIIGGIKWTISGGDKEGMAKAKDTVTYAIIGLALGLLSFVLVNILGTFFNLNLVGP